MNHHRGKAALARVERQLERPDKAPDLGDFIDAANLLTYSHLLAGIAARAVQKLADGREAAIVAGHPVPAVREIAEVLRMTPEAYYQLTSPTQPKETR